MLFLDLIFLLFMAGIIFSRLWQVLGRKTDTHGRQPFPSLKTVKADIKKHKKVKNDFYEGFNESEFLDGASIAFKMILTAHHKGDKETLKKLVSSNLEKAAFAKPPSEPPSEVCLISNHIQEKYVKNGDAFVKVHFTTQQVYGATTLETADNWTFKRTIKSENPNWMVWDIA